MEVCEVERELGELVCSTLEHVEVVVQVDQAELLQHHL